MKTKTCSKCKIEKPVDEFYGNKSRKDGLESRCKSCSSVDNKKYKQTDKGRKIKKLVDAKYRQTGKGKESIKKWRKTDSGKIYNKNYLLTEKSMAARLKVAIKIAENTGSEYYAWKAVEFAKKLGVLVSEPCPFCGKTTVQGHHENYRKPLDVQWLCQQHHSVVGN